MGTLVTLPLFLSLAQPALPKADLDYLKALAKDTWSCIADMADPKTGLPYDNSDRGEHTSVSNIGVYLSSVVLARRLRYIDEPEANRRIGLVLSSLEKMPTHFGFQQSWHGVVDLKPSVSDPWVSVLDSGNLAAGLLTVAGTTPSHAKRSRLLFDRMDWGAFYDQERNTLFGGYNVATKKTNPEWRLQSLGTDARPAQFLAVATGKAPAKLWEGLERATETRNGHTYLKPGWEGGGLFMQYLPGIWLDEKQTIMGESAREFTRAQMKQGMPWGWSACDDPNGGYLGWGALKDDVVTPHASALAVEDFPKEVVANLRNLETMRLRVPGNGFLDSIDVRTGKRSKLFLVLDQSMLFLSLGNYLTGGYVRDGFGKSDVVRQGLSLLPDYRKTQTR